MSELERIQEESEINENPTGREQRPGTGSGCVTQWTLPLRGNRMPFLLSLLNGRKKKHLRMCTFPNISLLKWKNVFIAIRILTVRP